MMVFYGDVNLPYLDISNSKFQENIEKNINIFNFESTIVECDTVVTDGIALRSKPDVVRNFFELGFGVACLANNHTSDYNDSITSTISNLNNVGFRTYGAGENLEHASKHLKISLNGIDHYFIAAGWDVIGCKYASEKKPGVNPYCSSKLKKAVEDIRLIDEKAVIYCTFHYNYEFELYPQPADRLLFHELIDLGADYIIGHHSHLVGPYERYKGKYIFYSLGNFYMPEVISRGYRLKYPEVAYHGISVDLSDLIPKVHFYQTVDNTIKYIESKQIDKSDLIDLCELVGKEDYLLWFNKNRKKKKLLPVFTNYNNKFDTRFKANLVKFRNYLINFSVRLKLKK
ncbi:CapA family protein [Vibrio alginolyticus]